MKTSLRLKTALLSAGLALCSPVAAAMPSQDPLSKMFTWWNRAFLTPGGYTQQAFDHYFTKDATLELNGKIVIRGTAEWATYFQAIQSRGGVVEIVVPFKQVFVAGDKLYTYHIIRSRRNVGVAGCMLASGYATLKAGKIASLMLVRHALEPAKDTLDPLCWTN
jgi:hypothetical protein